MSGLLWTKWYFPDWTNDPGLRASSIASRGLWMDMLCIAARHDPPGYVAINGNGLATDTLARMVGASVPEIEPLLAELERNGVFSRNRNGVIYSRRMVRETKAMKIAKENGKKGGNPNIRKTTVISEEVNPPVNPPLNTHKPEAKKQERIPLTPKGDEVGLFEERAGPSKPKIDIDEKFEQFRQAYPTRDGANPRKPAYEKFKRLIDGGVDPDAIIRGAAAYRDQQIRLGKNGTQYVKQAQFWLNQEGWRDDYGPASKHAPTAVPQQVHSLPDSQWSSYLQRYANGLPWPDSCGPPPGKPGCRAPPALIQKFGFNEIRH
jgi:hypothetical protein